MRTLRQRSTQPRTVEGFSSPSDALDELATIKASYWDVFFQKSLNSRHLPALKLVRGENWDEGSATAFVWKAGESPQHPSDFPAVGIVPSGSGPYGATSPQEFWYDENPTAWIGYPERQSLKKNVGKLTELAGNENWDGEGAPPLEQATIEMAQKLVDAFPPSAIVHQPDVSATPHGEVDFDWVLSKKTMLTVSVCPSGEIAFAGIFENSQLDGKEPWVGGLPYFVEMCLNRLHLERLHRSRSLDYHSL